jgi:nitrogen regulatory protein P-II 1
VGLVRPDKVDAVKKALGKINVVALTVAEARDHSPQKHETIAWMGHIHNIGSSLKMEIRLVVHDDDADKVISAIMRSARTGRAGDGQVCVTSVDHRYNICSGERDVSWLSASAGGLPTIRR